MKKATFTSIITVLSLGYLIAAADSKQAKAADHLDGPAASADPAADITDVYAWMQDSERINLVLNVFPLASESSRFSDSVQYVFHINSIPGYGQAGTHSTLLCTFSADQHVSCSLDGEELISNANATSPLGFQNADNTVKIFTGLRNDPFYFDLQNFNAVRATVRDAAGSLEFDEAGCPALDQATKDVLVNGLVGNGGLPGTNRPARDFFEPLNVLSIVIQADRGLFGNGPLYSVSASTHRRP